jgi:hypothetical protein
LALRLELRRGIPTGDARALRGPARRTTLLRAAAGLALLVTLAAAFLVATDADVQSARLLPSDTTAVVVLDLSASIGNFRRVGETLSRVARSDQNAGLVVFSGGAYEVIPPGAPARELGSLVRFFTPIRGTKDVYPANPWDAARFRGGTSIASGLEAARYALERDAVQDGSILLVSDLDAASDPQGLSDALVALRRDGIELRVVPLSPLPEHRAFFERIAGRATLLADADPESPVQAPEERRAFGTLPTRFLLAGTLLLLILAANERLLTRLDFRT